MVGAFRKPNHYLNVSAQRTWVQAHRRQHSQEDDRTRRLYHQAPWNGHYLPFSSSAAGSTLLAVQRGSISSTSCLR